jgi:5-methylthioribose kinase
VRDLNIEDVPALLEYLRQNGIIGEQETPVVRKLEGGVSNRVVLVRPKAAKPLVLKQALEKLRVQVDWFCTPARAEREALALKYLCEFAPPDAIPALVFQDSEQHLFAMEEVPEPHQNWKQLLLSGDICLNHVEQFGILLGSIHNRSAKRIVELRNVFGDRSVFEVLRLEPYYRYTASQVPESVAFMNELIADTLACAISIVHGDYSPKNILIHDGRLKLVDCEVVHVGDPAFDIGFSMAHLLSKANHLRPHRMSFAGAASYYWYIYSHSGFTKHWVAELEPRAVRHTIACCLARVAGRSPLEYLSAVERAAQTAVVLGLLQDPPAAIPDLVFEFVRRLECQSSSA